MRALRGMGQGGIRVGREQDAQSRRRRGESCRQRLRFREHGNPCPAALLAGRDRNAAPVSELAPARVAIESHDAARRHDRHDRGDAELRRLLHHEVHALGACDALHQGDVERRLRARGDAALDHGFDRAAADPHDARRIILAVAVEEGQRIAGPEPQHAAHMGDGGAAERYAGTFGECRVRVHADHAHAASTAPAATPASQSISSGAMT